MKSKYLAVPRRLLIWVIGQYTFYDVLLKETDPERAVFLGVDQQTYDGIFSEPIGELMIDTELLIDPSENYFQVVRVGWLKNHGVHGASLHLDIIDDKIWIQRVGTDRAIAENW